MEQEFPFPDSSALTRAGYDPDTRRLRVWFRRKGFWRTESGPYTHYRVPADLVSQWIDALSKGGFYNEFIRGRYR